jgi:hypothetical protein
LKSALKKYRGVEGGPTLAAAPPPLRQLAASKARRQDVQLYVSRQFFQIDMKRRFPTCVSVERRVEARRGAKACCSPTLPDHNLSRLRDFAEAAMAIVATVF